MSENSRQHKNLTCSGNSTIYDIEYELLCLRCIGVEFAASFIRITLLEQLIRKLLAGNATSTMPSLSPSDTYNSHPRVQFLLAGGIEIVLTSCQGFAH